MKTQPLRLEDLPDAADRAAVFAFAMTFNGYERFGSFIASAEAAQTNDRTTIDGIRNELFFAARGSRHRDDDAYLAVYREILPGLRAILRAPPEAT